MIDILNQTRDLLVAEGYIKEENFSTDTEIFTSELLPFMALGRDNVGYTTRSRSIFEDGSELSAIKGGGAHSSPGTCEIGFFEANDGNLSDFFESLWGDTVLGYQTPQEVLDWCKLWVIRNAIEIG